MFAGSGQARRRGAGVARRRAVGAGLLALMVAAALTGCTAQPDLRSKRIENPVRGTSVNATVGDLRLIGIRIEAPTDQVHVVGDNVGMFLTISNEGTASDRLTSVTTASADQVVLRSGAQPPGPVSVDLPPRSTVSMQYPGGAHLELVHLRHEVPGGRFMPVVFRFSRAGSVQVNVFVQGFSLPTVPPTGTAKTS